MTKFFSIAVAALLVSIPVLEANAANIQQQQQQPQINARRQPSQTLSQQASTRCQYEFQSQKLTQMVDLPEVPQYTGQMTFVAGTYFPNAKSGASITMKVRTMEYAGAVKDWYSAALQQSGWKIEQAMSNEHTVAAWKGKQLIQVIVNEPSHNRFRADVLIRYRFGG
ncbi:MAG: hypothetical protein DKT66_09010 [Candidatus Melainabacteria bacterium]|nr:MAG: hypothetical protein DKT66_09010 [Candidatus Melainabacteria bacterium]